MKKIILHLFADIGSDTKPYQDRPDEYEVICVGSKIGVENYKPPKGVYGIIANPPCTHFSIARTRAATPRNLREGMRLVKEALRVIWECQYDIEHDNIRKPNLKFWAIENPATGFLRWFLGKPSFQYCPSEYGAPFTKMTALWGHFNEPIKPFMSFPIQKTYSLVSGRKGDPTSLLNYKDRTKAREQQMHDRSTVYPPFAQAFYEANK